MKYYFISTYITRKTLELIIVQKCMNNGKCIDNCKMESFFSILKKAIWFWRKKKYKTSSELTAVIDGLY